MELPTIEVTHDDVTYAIDLSDIDALEWRALREETGLMARDALDAVQKIDPFTVAALLWVRLRRDTPDLDFEEVAGQVTLGTMLAKGGDPVPPADAGS